MKLDTETVEKTLGVNTTEKQVTRDGANVCLSCVLPLDTDRATLSTAGGKGENLVRLVRNGFPVPPGFIITTAAYDATVAADDLTNWILETARSASPDDPQALEKASAAIRARFLEVHMLPAVASAIGDAYAALGSPPVAVRSSATAEDLPGVSFAGQQDTTLNVVGEESLLKAVVDCWSSLWTARAIGYRARNGFSHTDVSLAVVVQEMVDSQTSGVLFTANPLTGKRTETVIEATLGLGEALVSGQVDPDYYLVDEAGLVREKTLGIKALAIHARAGGGTVAVEEDAGKHQALPDEAILELAQLGRRVVDLFGAPQDIEWARVNGHCYLLQSRPITTLYPLPAGMEPEPLRVMASFGAVQGMLDPMTPIGQDAMRVAFVGAAELFGRDYTEETQPILRLAGERLWIDLTGLVNNRVGQRLALAALPFVDPVAAQALRHVIEDGRFPSPGNLRLRTGLQLLRLLAPMAIRAVRTLIKPDVERERMDRQTEALVAGFEDRMAPTTDLQTRMRLIRHMGHQVFHYVIPQFVPRFGMGMATLNLLRVLASDLPDGENDVLALMRGLPHNVTTEMDLALWQTAQAIRAVPDAAVHFDQTDAKVLAAEYMQGQLPEQAQTVVAAFLARYGVRGLAEIDLGRPRWREDPTPVMQVLQSYLQIEAAERAPDAAFERGRAAAETGIEQLVASVRETRGGWFKSRLVRWAARRMRALAGLRESPKFAAVRIFSIMRTALLENGQAFVEKGVLSQPDDVCFLYMAELEALAAGEQRDWTHLVQERRQVYAREQLRRRIPQLLLSDGQAFYEGGGRTHQDNGHVITGSPVSPGMAEGIVRVVFDPHGTQLAPGEILVCPGTDPSWTPLFLAASGLVMEVGGMMTHGSVVAREYGIPAVVGVHEATRRLHTGQRVRVNGNSGQIVILTDAE
jgi:phosphoenolpyruvate synthase/pyruvate phosphate dikinase